MLSSMTVQSQHNKPKTNKLHSALTSDAAKLMLCGGVSGSLSKTCTAPLGRLTILYQVEALPQHPGTAGAFRGLPGLVRSLQEVVRSEGLLSLWKGNLATILHRIPYSAANFAVYELSYRDLRPYVRDDVVRRLVSGSLAGLAGCVLAYPLDLLRTRLAAQTQAQGQYYRGIGHALRRIVREEGLGGLYKGLGPTLTQVMPSLALHFCCYNTMREALEGACPAWSITSTSLLAATVAGFGVSSLTFPLDVVRRRMQVQGKGMQGQGASYWQTCHAIHAAHGWGGFYRGILPEYCKVIPGMVVAFVTFETMKRALLVHKGHEGIKS